MSPRKSWYVMPMNTKIASQYNRRQILTSALWNLQTNPVDQSDRLSSRFLTATALIDDDDDVNRPNVDDFLGETVDRDYEPGNRLEASGFNADDLPAFVVSYYGFGVFLFCEHCQQC